jgi:hypothetical protein
MGFDAADGDVGNSRPAHYPPPPPPNATGSPPPPGQNHEAEHPTNVGMDLNKEDFEYVTSQVMRVADVCCNGRVVSVLEGGYGAYNPLTGFQREKPSRTTRAKAAGGNTNGGGSNGNGNGGSSTSNNGGTTGAPSNGTATTTQVHMNELLRASSIGCFTVGLPLFVQEGLMNRDLLVNSVLSHVRKLVDPYGQ